MVKSKPLQCKELLVRSHCSGHIPERGYGLVERLVATGGELFATSPDY